MRVQHRIEQHILIGVEMKLALADQFSKYGASSNPFAIREPKPELSIPRVLQTMLEQRLQDDSGQIVRSSF